MQNLCSPPAKLTPRAPPFAFNGASQLLFLGKKQLAHSYEKYGTISQELTGSPF